VTKQKDFVTYKRKKTLHRPIDERLQDFSEIALPLTDEELANQASRCMDCGIPFCHGFGCPLKNVMPEINDELHHSHWQQACYLFHQTNNFPEITGRVCPAMCEAACTLAINDESVTIRQIELQLTERGFDEGWIKPVIAKKKTGKKVAVIGSGPAGLAAAQQLSRAGHNVVVFEKSEHAGGLLRYGIPDFKLEKYIVERRLKQMTAEGVEFQTGVTVGEDISAHYLQKRFDCICLAIGTTVPRKLQIRGSNLEDVYLAMDYLTMQNMLNSGEPTDGTSITAKDKVVVVIGGGDTGSDCVGTTLRQGAKEVCQLEILPKPPETRPLDTPWPIWPRILRTSTSHEEGCERMWSIDTKSITGGNGKPMQLHCNKVEWSKDGSSWKPEEVKGSEFTINADLVLLALGFLHVEHSGLVTDFELDLDNRGNIVVNNYQISRSLVFATGDAISGASLVARAINSGREAAAAIDSWLKK
jgi:glutamate synthase (NADPH) small chain